MEFTQMKFTTAWLVAREAERRTKKATQRLDARPATELKPRRGESELERRFAALWAEAGGPVLQREFRFHPARKWRADFAHEPSRTLIEIEGGAWGGRHTHGTGFLADAEKYFEAYLLGWKVVRLTKPLIEKHTVAAIVQRCSIAM